MTNRSPLLVILLIASSTFAQHRRGPANFPADMRVMRDVEYARAPGEIPLRLDLYLPKSDKPLPLVIFVHGGGWRAGDKSSAGPVMAVLGHGYALASINYRLTDVAPFPAQIHDCKAAVRFLRAHADDFNLDAKHFAAWGSSAGGHLVALLGTSGDVAELEGDLGNSEVSSRVQAVIDCWGPADFFTIGNNPNGTSATGKLLGGPPAEKKDLARLASPVTHVTPDDPPFLIAHGTRDPLVPVAQGQAMHDALQKANVASELILTDAGHGWAAAPPMDKAIAFLDRHLKSQNSNSDR
jgi:acetyl esterase/lipase